MQGYKALREVVQKEIDDPMTGRSGIYVFDLKKQREVIQRAAEEQFLIASLTKIFTIGAALEHLGAKATFRTKLVATAPINGDGTLHGDLNVIGGGDPTLGTSEHVQKLYGDRGTRVEKIVEEIKRAGVQRVTGQLIGDGSLFDQTDTRHTNWITALSFNRTRSKQPVLEATRAIMEALNSAGVAVEQGFAESRAPTEGIEIGIIESPTVRELAIFSGHESDNFISEILAKQVASSASKQITSNTAHGCTIIEQHANNLGATINLLNGSGLKKIYQGEASGNTATPREVVNYLASVANQQNRWQLEETLPRAAAEGTLKTRMRNTAAAERVRAKTGTLTLERKPLQDSLAGYCIGKRRSLAFAVIYEEAETRFVARSSIDRIMDTLARYCA